MHPKIKKDSFYSALYPIFGDDGITEAGFFYDSDNYLTNPAESIDIPCTPFAFEGLKTAENPAILLSTGAFCPAHIGHLEMMKLAKKVVENNGYQVLGGYFSPGHDEYINSKTGQEAIPIHYRIRLMQELISQNREGHWLAVDPWEGLFNQVAVNFTDVIERLELYLQKWTGRKIPVFYICGADNARFALTFLLKGNCVIMGRPGYVDRFEYYKNKLIQSKNVLWQEAENPENSSELRKNNPFEKDKAKKLFLRVEGLDSRENEVIALLKPYFESVKIQYLSEQKVEFDRKDKAGIISLDAMLSAAQNLEISRCYDLFGTRFLEFSERPGSLPLTEQALRFFKDKRYSLFDDDRHSGATLQFTSALLAQYGIDIKDFHTLSISTGMEETLDCRDFIIGGNQNGLVVKIGTELYRVPYIYPYCCPFVRASISDPMKFSKAVWTMNRDYFIKDKTLLGELPKIWQNLFGLLGFKTESSLAEICEWHLRKLG